MTAERIKLQAPAKVNLGLEVLHRRADGFHDVNTIYAAIDLCDEIELAPRDDGEIVCLVQGDRQLRDEPSENNLCTRAARMVQEVAGVEKGMTIHLRKRIPTGAGLGGGSSDAATLLLGAAKLWEAKLSPGELASMAAQLGSDVPFFLGHNLSHATSRGEVLVPLDFSLPWTLLLINPGVHIPTPWAYRAINRTGHRQTSDLVASLRSGIDNPSSLQGRIVNDFEEAVFAEYPQLKQIKERLYELGAFFALMSGSGSTLFGLFEDPKLAEAAKTDFVDCWSLVVRFRKSPHLTIP